MKMALKIWVVSILYHTLIFHLLYGGLGGGMLFLFVPAQMIGGLPGLFIYGAILFHLYIGNYTLKRKWVIAITGILLSTMIATLLTVLFFEVKPSEILENYLRLYGPVSLASLLALGSFVIPVNKYFHENTVEKNP